MSAQMRAAVYHGRHDLRVEDVARPVPGGGELLLEVGTVGVCGSDSGEWANGAHQYPLEVRHPATGHLGPIIPGHEFSGTVVGVGDDVDSAWIGRQVASCGSIACGRCAACLRGESNMCATYAGVGLHRDGALAEYVTTAVESCVPVDGLGISLDEAALCQPMAIAVHCVRRAGEVAGQTVLVQGVGGIGAFLVYALAESGAEVIASDIDESRLDIARQMGAAVTVRVAGDEGDPARILEAVDGRDLRVLFEVSGSAGGITTSLAIAPKGARIVVVGMQKRAIDIDLRPVTLYERSLIGTNAQVREVDFPRAVELIARRPGGWSVIAPYVLPLDEVVESALRPMAEGRAPAIKQLIDPRASARRPIRVVGH